MKINIAKCLLVTATSALFAASAYASVLTVSSDSRSFRMDTRSVPVVDASAPVSIAYSGEVWGVDGAGATASISAQYVGEEPYMLGIGLSGVGLFSWWPDKNGLVTLSLVSGTAAIEKRLEITNVKRGFILIVQ